ncbi:MAG: hypothetical protein AAF514_11480 [Verrucomicrobiota bacterium]
MKINSLVAVLAVAAMVSLPNAVFGQAEVGSASTEVQMSLFENGILTNKKLSDFEGKVILINYYTPW